MTDGLIVVDKPAGWTSHDVVARVRRVCGTRRVGHAGTLDPMATGVLVLGVGRATRLLGYLAAHDKDYEATIRLGATTTTDDAEGEVVAERDAGAVTDEAIEAGLRGLTGDLLQVPSAVSAIKVDGVRAYQRVRSGENVELAARPVRVERLDLLAHRGCDLDVRVTCSTGTYVRALARDLGDALGVGAHLRALRRTRVGRFGIEAARPLADVESDPVVVPLAEAVGQAFPTLQVSEQEAVRIAHGQRLALEVTVSPSGVFAPDGSVVALVADRDGVAQPICVFR